MVERALNVRDERGRAYRALREKRLAQAFKQPGAAQDYRNWLDARKTKA